ncbi:ABC transporter permease [Marinimicrobium sp. ABcell2]|uniref:ABC transporter permease n=1 Tax=Marinimicrobium sp. ABcell2 TaxID=3069751 RepID=UPI0027B745C4|nr:ABC transporter permease [Marinimicrobium sp. ABcell2]MDQ2076782.1 ABC transporter permease [Marinimicrobium sp. ABcell2]
MSLGSTTESQPGRIEQQASDVCISGDWTLLHYAKLKQVVAHAGEVPANTSINLQALGVLDTAGAALLVELLGTERLLRISDWAPDLPEARKALLETVAEALSEPLNPPTPPKAPVTDFLARVGAGTEDFWQQFTALLGFIGLTLEAFAATVFRPSRWRLAALAMHIKQTGVDTIPIIALLTFLVGAVVAFLGATVLGEFGAGIYTVNLVGFSFLREFGVVLAAIMLAGRTASAFAAHIGSMKANDELDAIRVLGLNPIELLVLPRVLAMVITLPILAFVGMIGGLLGGLMVCLLVLDISIAQYFAILHRDIPVHHLWVGLSKAPVFAFVIAVIGCLEGFKVTGSARSVGEHTTSSVVQSIFVVILLDAVAALFFMEMGW